MPPQLSVKPSPQVRGLLIETVPAGQALRQPEPLFIKLDPKVAEEELERLQAALIMK